MLSDSRLLELLAEAAHNAWMDEKINRGVETWPNEDGVEQLVRYDRLDERIKEFDRIVVRAIAETMVAAILTELRQQ